MATFRELLEAMMPKPMEEIRKNVPQPTGVPPQYPKQRIPLKDIPVPAEKLYKVGKEAARGMEAEIHQLQSGVDALLHGGYYDATGTFQKYTKEQRDLNAGLAGVKAMEMIAQYQVAPKAFEGMLRHWSPKARTLIKSLMGKEAQRRGINLAQPAYKGLGAEIHPELLKKGVSLEDIIRKPPTEGVAGVGAKVKPRVPMTPAQERALIAGKPKGAVVGEPKRMIELVYPQKELSAGINMPRGLGYIDKDLWQQKALPKIQKFIQEKTKPIFKQFVELDDAQRIAGMPEVMETDKPWWGTIKSVFGKGEGQSEAITAVRHAEKQLFRSHRKFLESPLWKRFLALTPEERIGVRAVTEGRASMVPSMRQEVKDVIQLFRNADVKEEIRLINFAAQQGYKFNEEISIARKLQPLMKITGQSANQLVAQGLDVDNLVYWRHYSPKHWKDWLGRYLRKPIRGYKAGYLKRSKGTWDYLDDAINDPAITVPVQNAERSEHAIRMQLIKDMQERFGKPIPESGELLPGYRIFEPKGHLRFYPIETIEGKTAMAVSRKVPRFQMPSAVVSELNYTLGSSERWEKVARMTLDKLTNTWRTSVLALSPRWVVNNTIGNTTLNTLGDVNPKSYFKAIKVFNKAADIAKKDKISFQSALEMLGVSDDVYFGLYETETGAALRNIGVSRMGARNTLEKIADFAGWAPKKVYKINSRIESFYRTAHYLDKMGKGATPEAALKSVNEFLFDYGALSWAERSIVRRMVPFYSWTKNITRLAMTYPVKNPTRTVALGLGAKLMTDYLRDNHDVIIDWKEAKLKIPTDEGNSYLVIGFRGANPFTDIVTPLDLFTGEGMTNILAKMAPWIKMPVERATGTQVMPWGAKEWTAPVTEKDKYGKEKRPLPSIPRHIGLQFPQFQTAEHIAKPYAKYTATGEMIVGKGGRIYPRNPALDVLRLLGANISTEDLVDIQKRGMLEEYNKKKGEKQWQYYNKKKEIILGDYEKFKEMSERKPEPQRKATSFKELMQEPEKKGMSFKELMEQ